MGQRAPSKAAAPAQIITAINLGYNGYTDPTQCNPQMWATADNVYAGAFGYVQRCRFANVYNQSPPTGLPYTTLKYFALPGVGSYLLADQNGKLYSYDTGNSYVQTQRINPYWDPAGVGSSLLNGPWMRETLENIVYEMNGQVKQAGRLANAATIEGWGLDAPDSTPQVQINAGATVNITSMTRLNGVVTATLAAPFTLPSIGTLSNTSMFNVVGGSDPTFDGTFSLTSGNSTATFVWAQLGQNNTSTGGSLNTEITKAVGRSYAMAWENVNKNHVGAPGPATQYIQYASQYGVPTLVEPGTITATTGSPIVTGVGTFFSSAWVGRSLWGNGVLGRVLSVQSNTQLTLYTDSLLNVGGVSYIIFDPQATHIRLYATADGGATYFRIQRNAWVSSAVTEALAGLQFADTANSEPPNFPFTTEIAQANNVPPPVGYYVNQYQGRLCVFGVPGALQSFFYSNVETTTVGLQQESFAPLNQVTLPIQNAQIMGMIELPGDMIIWSNKQDMFRLTGLLTDNTVSATATNQGSSIASLPYNLGIANPFACDITPLGAFWLSSNNEIWLFTDRYAPRNIGRPVQDILSTITQAGLLLARVKYYHASNRNWLAVSIAANAASYNNTVLILDLDLLASNGSPSYFTFDMATNSPSWFIFTPGASESNQVIPNIVSITYAGGAATTATVVVSSTAGIANSGNVAITGNSNPLFNGTFGIAEILGTTEVLINFSLGTAESGTGGKLAYPAVPTYTWFQRCDSLEVVYESSGFVRLMVAQVDLIQDIDYYLGGYGTEITVPNGSITTHAWGNDSAYLLKSPKFIRFNTNRDPSMLASDGWTFAVYGIDDDYYTFDQPLSLSLIPGVNDSSALGGNPDFVGGLAFRHSPELYKIGAVNFIEGRRLKFQVNFPTGTGVNYQLRSISLGFGAQAPF
jgi:hypothetical protein